MVHYAGQRQSISFAVLSVLSFMVEINDLFVQFTMLSRYLYVALHPH